MKTLVKYLIYMFIIVIFICTAAEINSLQSLFAMSEDINTVGIMTNEAFKAFQEYYAPELHFWSSFGNILRVL